ncbi:MAG: ATP-binding protein [Chitinophagaceae bacterium]|nr:ATP-binding protein [Oligoflexus sp.]
MNYRRLRGYTCLYTTASALVIDLGAQDSRLALQRKLTYYESKDFLIINEIGYLSFDCKAADFIFEIVNRCTKNWQLALRLIWHLWTGRKFFQERLA